MTSAPGRSLKAGEPDPPAPTAGAGVPTTATSTGVATATNPPGGDRAGTARLLNAPTARRDFWLLWSGQSLSLFGDRFMVLALPLLATITLGVSPARATLLAFALNAPFLLLGLPAGVFVDRSSRRKLMLVANAVQVVTYGMVWLLAAAHGLSYPLLVGLVLISGCAVVFFQVAYASFLPSLYRDPQDLHRGNARLALSESTSRVLGPAAAGPVIAAVGAVGAVAANALSFVASVASLLLIRHREAPRTPAPRGRGWIRREVMAGLRFALGHPILRPVLLCSTTYGLFLSMVNTTLVLYCRNVLGLSPQWIGVVVGAAAVGYPVGNLMCTSSVARLGMSRTLILSAAVSVAGIVAMPAFGSMGGTAGATGLVAGSIVHCIGEGAFAPSALTLRQTRSPAELLGRVASVQRFLLWSAVALGSLFAAGVTAVAGLAGAVWVGALGTVLCLPVLLQRGIREAAVQRR